MVQFKSICDRMMILSQLKNGVDQDLALRVWTTGFNRNKLHGGLNQNEWWVPRRHIHEEVHTAFRVCHLVTVFLDTPFAQTGATIAVRPPPTTASAG